MWFKKKKIEAPKELEVDKDLWIKKLLADYNLLDVENLMALAEIEKDKVNKVLLEEAFKYLQPKLMEEVKKGRTSYCTSYMEKEEFDKLEFMKADFSKLNKYGIVIESWQEENPYQQRVSNAYYGGLQPPTELLDSYKNFKPKHQIRIRLIRVTK